MLNSNVFIGCVSSMRTPIDRSPDLPGVIAGISRRAVHADLAAVPVGMRAVEPAPVTLAAPSPTERLRECHRLLNLSVRMAWSGHARASKMAVALTSVNTTIALSGKPSVNVR
jgi:hypothetical protein